MSNLQNINLSRLVNSDLISGTAYVPLSTAQSNHWALSLEKALALQRLALKLHKQNKMKVNFPIEFSGSTVQLVKCGTVQNYFRIWLSLLLPGHTWHLMSVAFHFFLLWSYFVMFLPPFPHSTLFILFLLLMQDNILIYIKVEMINQATRKGISSESGKIQGKIFSAPLKCKYASHRLLWNEVFLENPPTIFFWTFLIEGSFAEPIWKSYRKRYKLNEYETLCSLNAEGMLKGKRRTCVIQLFKILLLMFNSL